MAGFMTQTLTRAIQATGLLSLVLLAENGASAETAEPGVINASAPNPPAPSAWSGLLTSGIEHGVYLAARDETNNPAEITIEEIVSQYSRGPGRKIRNYHRITDPDHWILTFSFPFWLTEFEGTQTVNGEDVPVDVTLDNMWHLLSDYLDYAGNPTLELRRGRWFIFGEFRFLHLSGEFERGDSLPPLVQSVIDIITERLPNVDFVGDFKTTRITAELAGGYRFLDRPWSESNPNKRFTLDAFAGMRYWQLEATLNVDAGPRFAPLFAAAGIGEKRTRDWFDPFIGLRAQFDLTEKLFLFARGDIGGFGIGTGFSSRFTWRANAGLAYAFTPRALIFAGYNMIDVDYDDGLFGYDILTAGPVIGLSYAFGGPARKK